MDGMVEPLTEDERERAQVFYSNGNPAPSVINEHKWVAEPLVQHMRELIIRYEATCIRLELFLGHDPDNLEKKTIQEKMVWAEVYCQSHISNGHDIQAAIAEADGAIAALRKYEESKQ
jgi:hypothetical protein